MITVPAAAFLKEFTLYADQVSDTRESLIVTRHNDKDIVVLSLAEYNELKKQIFMNTKQNL